MQFRGHCAQNESFIVLSCESVIAYVEASSMLFLENRGGGQLDWCADGFTAIGSAQPLQRSNPNLSSK